MRLRSRRARRVSAGGVEAWRAALAELRRHRRDLLIALPVFAGLLALVNLPWIPAYERGLLTGVLVVGALWGLAWIVWVTSGLSLRLNGVWAEGAMNHELASSSRIYGVVPSVKLAGYDVDTVAVSRGAVLAVETKWHLGEARDIYLADAAYQAARACRSLRLQFSIEGLSPDAIRPLVILCGRTASQVHPHTRQVQVGSVTEVEMVGAAHLDSWLEGQRGGHIAPDFADRILRELRTLAEQRDLSAIQAGWVLRRLARIT